MEQIINDLKTADRAIKKQHRYLCGLMTDAQAEGLKAGKARFFFESPDGQNGELYSELLTLGFSNAGYNAPYYWKMTKDGYLLEYTEGDIYITKK